MKICMLAYAHYLNDARIKSYVRTLEGQGHQVDIIALRSEGEAAVEDKPSGTIFRIMDKYQGESTLMYSWSYLRFFLKSLFLLARRAFRHRYDVVHVHNMPNVLVLAAIVPKLLGARVLLDVHDLMMANYMVKFNVGEKNWAVRVLKMEQGLSAMVADHVFCADHNQQEYLVESCRLAKEKVTVLLNLPNVEMFQPIPKDESAQKEGDQFRIVYHGTIAHRLGIDLIVRAMARVVDLIPAELWVYGSGDYLPEVLALASQLGVGDKVHFSRSFFPVEKIPEIVCGMDLGIIGNRRNLACDRYMLPVKLLEYVYLGVPVVAPRLSVISRYFDDSMVRFYEPENVEQMADSIVELLRNPEERERLARSAAAFYQKHNFDAQADLYLNRITGSSASFEPRPEYHV